LGDECFDFILGEFAWGGFATEFPFQTPAFSLDLGNPSGGDGDVAVVFEECSVLGEFGGAFFELATQLEVAAFVAIGCRPAGGGQCLGGGVEVTALSDLDKALDQATAAIGKMMPS
jgi:hypothetical protein